MSNFEAFIRAEMPLRQVLLYDQGDPIEKGYLATVGTYYLDVANDYKRYEKVGPGDYDWIQVGGGGGSGGGSAPASLVAAVTALSAEVFGDHVFNTMTTPTTGQSLTGQSLSGQSLSGQGLSAEPVEQLSRIDILVSQVEALSAETYSLSALNLSGHQSRIDLIDLNVAALSAEMYSLSAYNLSGHTSRVDILETNVNALSAEMYSLSAYNLSGHTSRIDIIETRLNELSGLKDNELQLKVEELSAKNEDDDTKIDTLSAKHEALDEYVKGLQTGDVEIQNRLAEVESSMGSIEFIDQTTLVLSNEVENLSATSVSCFDTRTYRTAKYVIGVHSGDSFLSMEMLVAFHNNIKYGKGIKHTAYALLGDVQLVEHNACLVGPYAILTFKPSRPGLTISLNRTLLTEQLPTIAYCGSTNLPVDRADTVYITGPTGVTSTSVGSNGVTVQTLDGEGTIAVSEIELGGPPYHFRMLQGNTLVALVTIPAKNEYELMRAYVYLKVGGKLYRGTPNPAVDNLVMIDQSLEAPTCEGFETDEYMYDMIPTGWDDMILVKTPTTSLSSIPVYSGTFATTIQTDNEQFALAVTGITIGGLPKHYRVVLPSGETWGMLTIAVIGTPVGKVYLQQDGFMYSGDFTTGEEILLNVEKIAPTPIPMADEFDTCWDTPTPTPTHVYVEYDKCYLTPTPTPTPTPTERCVEYDICFPTPTPTPTPTNEPFQTEMTLPVVLLGWDDSATGTRLTYDSHQLVFDSASAARDVTTQDFENMLNSVGSYTHPLEIVDEPTGSIRDYYRAISYDQMDVKFEILPASTSTSSPSSITDYAYIIDGHYRDYGNHTGTDGTTKLYNLREELDKSFIQLKENLSANGRDYYEEFGTLPIMFIHAGFDASGGFGSDYIWSHKWSFIDSEKQRSQNYNINPFKEKKGLYGTGDTRISSMGVMCHESLHSFGLPDLYDTTGNGGGLGETAIMASGSWGNKLAGSSPWLPSFAISWTRDQLARSGYFNTNIIDISGNATDLNLKPVYEENKCYRINHPNTRDAWYIEYRTPDSPGMNFDRNLPEEGLVIIHVSDKRLTTLSNSQKRAYKRRGESGYQVALEQRDGDFDLQFNTRDVTDDYFRPGDTLTPYTLPSTVGRSGDPSGVHIYNIRKIGNEMLFDVSYETEPLAKITEVRYSMVSSPSYVSIHEAWQAQWEQADTVNDTNITVTVNTENVTDNSTMEMIVNPNRAQRVEFTASVVNNQCVFTVPVADLTQATVAGPSNNPGANIIRYKLSSDSTEQPWPYNDYFRVVSA